MFIKETLGTNIDQSTFEAIKNLMEKSGSFDYSKNLARDHIVKAKEALSALPAANPQVPLLSALSDWALERNR